MISFKQFLEEEDRKVYAKKIPDAPDWSHELAEGDFRIGDITFSARDGLGAVPANQSVYYHGFVAMMKPSVFMQLALPDDGAQEPTSQVIEKFMKEGYAIGIPFLEVSMRDLEDGKGPAKIVGHEGRGRMRMITRVVGDKPFPVHMLLTGGDRTRDVTPEFIEQVKKELVKQDKAGTVKNPISEIYTS